jgi:hypothetical protein
MASGDGGKGAVRVILLVCRAPGSCARAAGIHVMGVWEAAHHLRAHSRRAQALVCLGENADKIPAGRVMLQVGEDVEGGSSARRTWGQQHIGNRGRAGDTERRSDIQHEWHIARNNFKIERVFNLAACRMKGE